MYVIGVDGGGTKTLALAADYKGAVLARSEIPGSNPNFVGKQASFQALRTVLQEIRQSMEDAEPSHVALCVPGLKRYENEVIEALGLTPERVSFSADVTSTFYGALGKETGIVALAGTGSFVIGTNELGETARAGGWGPVIGDEGSGHRIAVHALRAVGRHYDGIGPATLLTDKILAFYSTATPQELKSAVNLNNISKLTYLVREAADEGDTAAQIIISEAAQQLAQMASVVITRLGMNTAASELALTGGLARIGERFTGPFGKRLTELCPEIRQVEPLLSPAGGALLLAFRACGIPWSDELLAALKQTI
ncbi:MAG: hypothetical protein K0R67_1251 [Paenibacillus sp.]|nr:hypothetical protein [Paenibacillus sp.]